MVRNPVLNYIEELISQQGKIISEPGPVITISREYGCPGIGVSDQLASYLNKEKTANTEWKKIDKEIIQQAAEVIKVPAELIEKIAKDKPKGVFGQMLDSFGGKYVPGDYKVKKTVGQLIHTIAIKGHAVILGRAGAVIARDIQKSIHIHLHASKVWRVNRVKEMDHFKTESEAVQKINMVDSERVYLRNFYAGEEVTQNTFDLSLNCEYFSVQDIVEIILEGCRKKKLI